MQKCADLNKINGSRGWNIEFTVLETCIRGVIHMLQPR